MSPIFTVLHDSLGYELNGPRIESRGGENFRTCPDRRWGPPSILYNGYWVLSGGKERPRRDPDPSPLLVPWSWKSRAIPPLPLWTVRPIHSLSACTTVHFTFTLHDPHSFCAVKISPKSRVLLDTQRSHKNFLLSLSYKLCLWNFCFHLKNTWQRD
jgi:hypothetical protein